MRVIDAHHHLWDLDRLSYPWLTDPVEHVAGDYSSIRQSYLIDDFLADIGMAQDIELSKSVHVEADLDRRIDPVQETAWLQSIADNPASGGRPNAIVAYADLAASDVSEMLARHCDYPNTRGIRHMLNYASDPKLSSASCDNLMDDPRWRTGFAFLARHSLSFDLHIWPWQMTQAAGLARAYPDVLILLNHTGMPIHRDEAGLDTWREGMRQLAIADNVCVKVSGLGMLDATWTSETIRPLVLETIDIFGVDRCLFGSNFPVDKLSSGYDTIWNSFARIISSFTANERRKLLHDNAARCYRI